MSTLKNHRIIYDHECPLCKVYTGAFVKYGFLENEGRKGFNELNASEWDLLDNPRSFNEIPLINTKTGKVTYGIDSLFKILEHRIPVFRFLFRAVWFRWIIQKFYAFISYNRKAIVPGSQFEKSDTCAPSFNLSYRIAYLIFATVITAVVLSSFSLLLAPLIPVSHFIRELAITAGQVIVLGIALEVYDKTKVMYYLGNLMTVSLMGSLLLIPLHILSKFVLVHSWILLGYFGAVVLTMFIEHKRRLKILELPVIGFSLGWVAYRLFVLLLII